MNKNDDLNSAYLDGELGLDELQHLSSNARDSMKSYRMIGDVIRNDIDQASFMDVSWAVKKAVEIEPVYSVHHFSSKPERAAKTDTTSGYFDISAWFRPFAGMAIAASVAAVMVIGVQNYGPQSDIVVANTTSEPDPASVSASISTTQLPQRLDALVVNTANNNQDNEVRQRLLDAYLADHSGFAPQGSAQGMIPYMRVVSFESE